MILNIGLLVIGFVMLVKGADFFVDGAAGIAARLKIPDLIIGLTIVAMGTSAPEAAVSITAGIRGNAGITIGNIVGSNILNTFLILGVASCMIPIMVQKTTIKYDIPIMFAGSVLLLLLGMDGAISFLDGLLLWCAFIAFLTYLFLNTKKSNQIQSESKKRNMVLELLMIAGGLLILVYGSKISVYAATKLARNAGISERVIGLTIVALGTSLPELFTSVIAAKKGNADIAVGNIVGSNIFNILFIVGTTSLIINVPFDTRFLIDSGVMILSCVILFLSVFRKEQLNRISGVCFLACYAVYMAYLCMG